MIREFWIQNTHQPTQIEKRRHGDAYQLDLGWNKYVSIRIQTIRVITIYQ